MIISHRFGFIMIKTEKTAGTSLEIALSKYLGPQDVITPIAPEDESIRSGLGFRGAQNFRIRTRDYKRRDFLTAAAMRKPLRFYNHAPAMFIRDHLDPQIWDLYFKFAFERNPWDKAISMYWYRVGRGDGAEMPLNEYVAQGYANDVKGYELYSIANRVVVNEVFLFENMKMSLQALADRVGLPEVPKMPMSKSHYRRDRTDYRSVLSQDAAVEVSRAYAREIARFGYSY